MSQTSRWRFDPFGGGYNPIAIIGEQHTIEYVPELAKYGIFADEAIQFDSPSTVSISGYTEVSRLTTPTGTQFRVDYLADTYYGTGFIEFHSSQDGNVISLDYYGLGTIIHPNFRALTNYNFAGTVNIESDLTVDTDSRISGNLGIGGDAAATYDLKVYGTSLLEGNSRITGNLGIGGDADALYDLKVYGTSLFSDNLRIDSTTPFLILSKSDTSHGGIRFENDGVQRFYQYLSSSENYVLNRYDSGGVLVDVPLQVNGGTGDVTVANNLRVSGNLGIGGDADATYDLKVYGTSLLVGNSRISGNLGIGGDADATYDLKVYGTSYLVGNLGIGTIPGGGALTISVTGGGYGISVTSETRAINGTSTLPNTTAIQGTSGSAANSIGVSGVSTSGRGTQGNGGTFDFYAAGAGTNYGPFTGAHQFTIDNDIDILPGMILAIDYVREWVKDAAFSLSTTFPHLKIATENDTPYCIYNYSHQLEEDDPDIFFTFNPAWKKGAGNALGEGWIMACDINGVPKKGDILVLSEFPGYAKVLNPDTPLTAAIFSKIVGKVIDDIDFSAYPNVSKYPNVSNITKGGLVPIVYLLG
jgi:hypothetical protein